MGDIQAVYEISNRGKILPGIGWILLPAICMDSMQ